MSSNGNQSNTELLLEVKEELDMVYEHIMHAFENTSESREELEQARDILSGTLSKTRTVLRHWETQEGRDD